MSDKYTSVEQRVSYGIGRQMGDQLASNPFDGLCVQSVADGVVAALNGEASHVDQALMAEAYGVIRERMEAEAEKAKEGAKELAVKGEEYLAENAKRDEITVLASGLQYEVITAAEGDKPTAQSTVRTHYHGTLIDGSVFDSSYDRGQPAEFPVGGVIKGWTEALQLMTVGSKWRLYIPYQLAYGEQGAGAMIGPYTALVFDVELLAIVD